MPFAVIGTAACSGGSGPNLAGYPNLVHAPRQWGDHVACHSTGRPARDVAAAAEQAPASTTLGQLAGELGISVAEVLDAVRYCAAAAGGNK